MYLDYEKVIGWGVAIYAIMFLLWSLFVSYGFIEGMLPQIIGLIVLTLLVYRAGRSLGLHAWEAMLPYSIGWVAVVFVIDVVMSVPFAGWSIFSDPNLWISYTIIALAPLLASEDFADMFSK